MYVCIDRETMQLTHRAEDVFALCNVVYIENRHGAPCVFKPEKGKDFREFTDNELQTLHRNLTGEEYQPYNRIKVQNRLVELCEQVEPMEINAYCADKQASKIDEDDSKRYMYVHNSERPAVKRDLFEEVGLKATGKPQTGKQPEATPTAAPVVKPQQAKPVAPAAPVTQTPPGETPSWLANYKK